MSRPSPALVVAFLALLVSLTGAAVAAIPARDGDVHLCYDPRTGEVELVDTQRDRFRCPRAWRGFIVDSKPTELVSPNRRFKVEATNNGARMAGPQGRVEIGANGVGVTSELPVDVTSDTTVNVTGGSTVRVTGGASTEITGGATVGVTGGLDVNTTAGRDVNTSAGRNLNTSAGQNLDLFAGGTGRLRSLADLTVQSETTNLELLADDRARLRGKQALIEGLTSFRVDTSEARILSSGIVDIFASGKLSLKGSTVESNPPPSGP